MAFNKLAIPSVQEELGLGSSADIAALEADLLLAQNDISTLQSSLSNTQTDVTNLQGDVGTLQTDVASLQSFVGKCGSFYKSVAQVIAGGSGTITFDSTESWTDAGLLTQTSPTDFTVNVAGVYSLEAGTTIDANGSTWTNGTRRTLGISINRGGAVTVFVSDANPLSTASYSINILGTIQLQVGDIITVPTTGALLSGPGISVRGASGIDRNTFFGFVLVKL